MIQHVLEMILLFCIAMNLTLIIIEISKSTDRIEKCLKDILSELNQSKPGRGLNGTR